MNSSERDEFILATGASHEALEKLDLYAALLEEWNQKFNLVSPATLPHIWSRHFLDSAQLIKHMPETGVLADLGSGAGFPGMVLSIMGKDKVHLIESTGKKADFLQTVIDQLNLGAIVHKCRAEEMRDFKADIITARALAPLNLLFKIAAPLVKKDGICLFLKGQKAEFELTESSESWMFDIETIQSISDASGKILMVRNLKANAPHSHRKSAGKPKK